MAYYDPKAVQIIIGGYTLSGFSSDSLIKVEPLQKEAYTSQVGILGETNWSKQYDPRHKITISLMQNSPSNSVMEQFAVSIDSFSALISNISDGRYIGGGVDARVVERQSVEFGKEQTNRVWVIQVNDYKGIYLPESNSISTTNIIGI